MVLFVLMGCEVEYTAFLPPITKDAEAEIACSFFHEHTIVDGKLHKEGSTILGMPQIRVETPPVVMIDPGDPLFYTFSVQSYKSCGSISMELLDFAVEDDSFERRCENAEGDLTAEDDAGDIVFPSAHAIDCDAPVQRYRWRSAGYANVEQPEGTSSVDPDDGATLKPQIVSSDDELVFTFIWDSTEDAPSGTEITVGLFSYGWKDLATETFVPFHDTDAFDVTFVVR